MRRGGRAPRLGLLGLLLPSPEPRALGGRVAARPHPAFVLIPGGRGPRLLGGVAPRGGAVAAAPRPPRGLARGGARLPRHLAALGRAAADLLHIRGHADPDRPRVRLPRASRAAAAARSVAGPRAHPRGLLGCLRLVPAAGRGLRLLGGRRARGLAPSPLRVRLALEQEQQPGLGLRPVVPEPLPPRASLRLQRRRLAG